MDTFNIIPLCLVSLISIHSNFDCLLNYFLVGFMLLSLNYISTGRDIIAAIFFVASLGFQQMALYYAPAIGSYLLSKCLYLGPSQRLVFLS